MRKPLSVGQVVEVRHLQGIEVGTIESINWKTGKALVHFKYESCPHFDSFNIEQLQPLPITLVN